MELFSSLPWNENKGLFSFSSDELTVVTTPGTPSALGVAMPNLGIPKVKLKLKTITCISGRA